MSDSMLLGSATQAVGGAAAASGDIVDSMDLLGTNDDNTSSCDTSADDVLMLATQPVFKLPGIPLGIASTNSSCSELAPSLDADTLPVHTVPEAVDNDLSKVENVSTTGEEVDEETQCLESFTEIKDNLEAAAAEDEASESLPVVIPITSTEAVDDDDDETASNASEDLLANEEDMELQLDDTHSEVQDETSKLSNTTLTNISMIEASQPMRQLSKVLSVNNRTDVNSLTMEQTTVVESDIVSANDDTDAMSDASDNLLDDQEDDKNEISDPVPPTVSADPAETAALASIAAPTATAASNVSTDPTEAALPISVAAPTVTASPTPTVTAAPAPISALLTADDMNSPVLK